MIRTRTIALFSACALASQGCVSYHSYVKDKAPIVTATRMAEQGVQVSGHALSFSQPAEPGVLGLSVAETLEGPEESVSQYKQYDRYRYWSPAFIPAGVFLAIYGAFGGLSELGQDSDRVFYVNDRYPHCTPILLGGLESFIGIWPWAGGYPSCGPGGPPSSTLTQTALTGASRTSARPASSGAVDVEVTAYDAAGDVMKTFKDPALRVGADGTLSVDIRGYFEHFSQAPAKVVVSAALEGDDKARAQTALDSEASGALFRPYQEARENEGTRKKLARMREKKEQDGDDLSAAGDQAGALQAYMQAWKIHGSDAEAKLRLQNKIIATALRIDPPPEVPYDAVRHLAGAQAYAAGAAGVTDAVTEAEEAVEFAPWWPKPYYNLAVAQEKTGDYAGAAANLRFFLLAAPDTDKADEVRTKIAELESRQPAH